MFRQKSLPHHLPFLKLATEPMKAGFQINIRRRRFKTKIEVQAARNHLQKFKIPPRMTNKLHHQQAIYLEAFPI